MSPNSDVLVLGNGAIGLSVALEIQRRHSPSKVTVIGPSQRSGGASVAAGAMLGMWGEITKYTFGTAERSARFELGREAFGLWPAMFDDLGLQPASTGTFIIANSASGALDDDNWSALLAALDGDGVRFGLTDPREIPGLDPLPTQRPLRALFLDDEPAVDARALLAAMELAFTGRGGTLVDGTVEGLDVRAGVVCGARLVDGSTWAAGTTVVALGAATTPLLEAAFGPGCCIPVLAGTGTAFTGRRTQGPPFRHTVRTVNRAGSCGLHVVPLGEAGEYFGATNVIFRDPETDANAGMSRFLLDCAIEQLDRSVFTHRITRWHQGNRPVPIDMLPLIGRGPADGLVVATGTYRDGLHASPRIAQIVADAVEDPGHDPGAFAPRRRPAFPDESSEASIEEFGRQGVSGSFENDLRLPGFVPEHALHEWFAGLARSVFEQLELDRGLPVDLLHFLALDRLEPSDVDWIGTCLRALPTA